MPTHARWFSLRKIGLTAAIVGLTLVAAADGMAQQVQQKVQIQQKQPQQAQQKQQQPAPQSAWTKLCDKTKVAAESQAEGEAQTPQDVNLCLTFQERLNQNTGKPVVSVAIRQQEGEEGPRLMVIVPLGVDLRPDLQAKIDASEPVKLEYVRCGPVGCTAEAKATTDMMKALKTGRQIVIEAKGPLGRPVNFTLPLAGFATVYDGKASDAKQYQEARQRLVSLIRARRAEQIKKAVQALDNQQQSQQQPLPPQGQPRQPQQLPPQQQQPQQ